MSERLAVTLADLADKGIRPNDLTPDELVTLVHACERLENPYTAIRADLMARPRWVCGDVYLWPPTAGATVWLSECAVEWWGDESWLGRWAAAYALAKAREADAFCDDKRVMRRRIVRFALRLCCHQGELFAAMNECYGAHEHDAPDLKPPKRAPSVTHSAAQQFAKMVAALEAGSGIKREEWLWGRSVESITRSYLALMELSAAAFAGGDKREVNMELDEAVQNLARAVALITRRVRAEREAEAEKQAQDARKEAE